MSEFVHWFPFRFICLFFVFSSFLIFLLITMNYLSRSYTPKNVSVQVGMTTQDLVPAIYSASVVEVNEPVGWCIIPLASPPDPLDDITEDLPESGIPRSRRIVRTHLIQIEIISMHQNGRDTHVRQGKNDFCMLWTIMGKQWV